MWPRADPDVLHKGFGSFHLAVRRTSSRGAVLDRSGRGPNAAQPEL